MTSHIQHKPGCMALINCTVYHADGICPGPYGKCTCDQVLETPTVKEDTKKEHEESYIKGCGCDKCWKDAVRRLKEFLRYDPPKEPVKKPSQRIREIEDQLKRDQPNDMEDVMEYAVYCANMRSRAIIQYLNETQ